MSLLKIWGNKHNPLFIFLLFPQLFRVYLTPLLMLRYQMIMISSVVCNPWYITHPTHAALSSYSVWRLNVSIASSDPTRLLRLIRLIGVRCVYSSIFVYYWFSITLRGILPFILLLGMNSVIIYTLQQRSSLLRRGSRTQGQSQGQVQNDFKNIKMKKSERQIYIMLLLVTFAFLFLATPFLYLGIFIKLLHKHFSATPSRASSFTKCHQCSNVRQLRHQFLSLRCIRPEIPSRFDEVVFPLQKSETYRSNIYGWKRN